MFAKSDGRCGAQLRCSGPRDATGAQLRQPVTLLYHAFMHSNDYAFQRGQKIFVVTPSQFQ